MVGSMIKSYDMRVVVFMSNASSAWFVAFTVSNDQFTKSLNYSFHGYQAQPAIEISPKLTKVLFFGMASLPAYLNSSTIVPRADMFFMEGSSFKNITFPTKHLQNPTKVNINLGEQFVHLVKLDNSTVPAPYSEIVYYLSRDTVTVKVFEKAVSLAGGTVWVRS